MLTHFEHFNLSALLENLNLLHVCLLNNLDGRLLTILFVCSQFNLTELSLSKDFACFVEIEEIWNSEGLIKSTKPPFFKSLWIEVEDSWLVWRKHNLDWIERFTRIRTFLICNLFDESSREAVHYSVLRITLVSVAINFISVQHCPMLFESVWICFQIANTLLEQVLLLWRVAEVVYDLIVGADGARDVVRCSAHLLLWSRDKRWGWLTIACNNWAWPLSTITCVIGSFISWSSRCIPLNTLLLESRAEVLLV